MPGFVFQICIGPTIPTHNKKIELNVNQTCSHSFSGYIQEFEANLDKQYLFCNMLVYLRN